MIRFRDAGPVFGGPSDTNDNISVDLKWEPRNDSLVGKKRPPSTPHPETLDGSKKRSPGEYRVNEGNQMQREEESSGDDNENNGKNSHWEEFVATVDTKVIPNLDAYIEAKAIRTEASIRFENEIEACIQTLRNTTDEILSEVVEPICNQYLDSLNDAEESIIETIVSNHSRRNQLLELMQNADVAWSHKFTKLTTDIMGQNQGDQKCEVGNGKGFETNEEEVASQHPSKETISTDLPSGGKREKTVFGRKDSDWDELLEYEPSKDRIQSFLDERVKRNHDMGAFGDSLDDIQSGLESEIEGILQIARDLFNQHEPVCLQSEDEIEYFVMENYERKSNLQKELEKSAQHAQGLFADLLSRLSQSIS